MSEQSNFELMAEGVALETLFKPSDEAKSLSRFLDRQQSFRDLVLEVEGDEETGGH